MVKIRNLVLSTAVLAIVVTSLNFLTDSFSLSARLPDSGGAHHLDEARREGAGKLKDTRRRLERQPRLEQADAFSAAEKRTFVERWSQHHGKQQAPPVVPKQEAPARLQTAALPPPPPAAAQQAATQQAAKSLPADSSPPPTAAAQQAGQQTAPASSPPPAVAKQQVTQQAGQQAAPVSSPPPAVSQQQTAAGTGPAAPPPPPMSAGADRSQASRPRPPPPAPVPARQALTPPVLQAKLDELPLISQAQVLPAQNVSRQAANASAAASGVLPAQNTSAVLPGVGAVTGASNATAGAQALNKQQAPRVPGKQAYHVIASVNGNVYTQWQSIVCYYWYKKARAVDKDGVMGGFTRLLHSGRPDELMKDVPTVVVQPLPEGIDKGYVVLNRPYAFQQWAHQYLATLEEDYVLMAEPDHIFLKPLPLWATPKRAAAFPFFYIEPKKNVEVIQPYVTNGFPVEDMAPIGNSPVMLHKDALLGVVDTWYNLSLSMKKDPAAEKAFGWILEMYAFSIASATKPGEPIQYELHPELMIQPPWDQTLQVHGKDVYVLHFTYGSDYDERGILTYGQKQEAGYRFDKRDYSYAYPPLNLPTPPENVKVPSLRRLIACINEASAATPGWAAATAHD